MSYQKQNFANGEVLTASQLNHIENGIADVESAANATKGVVDKIIDPTLSLSGKAADAAKVGEAVNAESERAKVVESQIKEDVDTLTISSDSQFNSYFKELFIAGIDVSKIKKYSASSTSSQWVLNFKDANSSTIDFIRIEKSSVGKVYVSPTVAGKFVLAAIMTDKLKDSDVTDFALNDSVTNIQKSPQLRDYISKNSNSLYIPEFTKNFSARISIYGKIVSASKDWFYSSPIKVKAGDVVFLQSAGNAEAIPVAETNSTGSAYRALSSYSGLDPDVYMPQIEKDCYIAISAIDYKDSMTLLVYHDDTISKIFNNKQAIDALSGEVDYLKQRKNAIIFSYTDKKVVIPDVVSDVSRSLSDWVTADAIVTESKEQYDNVNRIYQDCIKVTSNGNNGFAYAALKTPINANTYPLLISVCLNEYTDFGRTAGLNVRLYSSGKTDSEHVCEFSVQGTATNMEYDTTYNRNGWFNLCVFPMSYKSFAVKGDSFDATNVTHVGLHILDKNTTRESTIQIAKLEFVKPMKKCGIVTIVDNFNSNVPAMADYAYSKGVRLNLSIIPGFYDGKQTPTCATEEELDRIKAQGHCIWNHTYTHTVLNDLSPDEIKDEINNAELWMKKNGYGDDRCLVSIPSAKFSTKSCKAVMETNAEIVFHVWGGEESAVYAPYYPCTRTLPTSILDSHNYDLSPTQLAEAALKCTMYGGISVVGFHGTYWDHFGNNGAEWKQYIDAIASAQGVYHYGIDEIRDGCWY